MSLRLWFKQLLAVAWLTVLETMRQPICLLLAVSTMLFIGLLPALIMHTMGEAQKLVQDSTLATHFVGGLLLAGYAACAALQHEIKRGTVATVLSKPVSPELFFLSKFLGVSVVLVLYSFGATMATLLSARMASEAYVVDWWAGGPLLAAIAMAMILALILNYFAERPYVSTAFGLLIFAVLLAFVFAGFLNEEGHPTKFGARVPWQVLPASVLVTMAILVLAAVAVSLATRLDTVPTLSICSVIFLAGLMTDYLLGRVASQNKAAALLYDLLPNWQHFWVVDALRTEGNIPWSYVGLVAAYGLFYSVGVLCLGVLAFRRMEVRS